MFESNGALDSINILTRFFVQAETSGDGKNTTSDDLRRDPILRSQARAIVQNPPTFNPEDRAGTLGQRDYYYWYYASLAMFQMSGELWRQWEGPMRNAIVETQRLEDGQDETYATYGSWDSDSAWGKAGGRVYATAINVLTLEVYYRYQRR